MEEKGVIAIFARRHPEFKSAKAILRWMKTAAPRLERKGWISDHEIERFKRATTSLEVWKSQDIVLPDFRGRTVVEDHVHPRQSSRRVVHFLPIQRQVETSPALCFIVSFEEQ